MGRRIHSQVRCRVCEIAFFPKFKGPRRFCSRVCYEADCAQRRRTRLVDVVCKHCGTSFRADPWKLARGESQFCSTACSSRYNAASNGIKRRNRVERTCEACGRVFLAWPAVVKIGSARFCSRGCAPQHQPGVRAGEQNPAWRGGSLTFTCALCGTLFTRKRSGKGNVRVKFCSASCRTSHTVIHMHKTRTIPERRMARLLEMLGVEVIPQHHIKGVGTVDFFVPSENVAVEVDGVYWHGTEKRRRLDAVRDAKATALGITTVRVPDIELV